MTCRSYRPIALTSFRTRFSVVDVRTNILAAQVFKPSLTIGVELEGEVRRGLVLKTVLSDTETGAKVVSQSVVLDQFIEYDCELGAAVVVVGGIRCAKAIRSGS